MKLLRREIASCVGRGEVRATGGAVQREGERSLARVRGAPRQARQQVRGGLVEGVGLARIPEYVPDQAEPASGPEAGAQLAWADLSIEPMEGRGADGEVEPTLLDVRCLEGSEDGNDGAAGALRQRLERGREASIGLHRDQRPGTQ